MNEHEIARIAAAMHAARPDWPIKQLTTLLNDDRMATRPRRDVFVALAWVACEAGTSSPYRVLEAGPWWKAAGIEGATTAREPFDQTAFCGTCGKPEARCQSTRVADDDHPFESVLSMRRRRETDTRDIPRVVDHLRDELVTAKAAPVVAAEKPCAECKHLHTPDGCSGPPSPSDLWAGVSPAACDCTAEKPAPPPNEYAEQARAAFGESKETTC